MARRCSHCGHNGHNSRTCLDMKGGFKLFGVRLSSEAFSTTAAESSSSSSTAMRKSFSMGNLSNYGSPEGGASPPLASPTEQPELGDTVEGYASDDLVHSSSNSRERKKGVPWTEEEHRAFLIGLQKLGKGDWRGISRNFVKTRTPTQVASHAQKYFLRRNNMTKRRRRSSLFDITSDTVSSLLGETVPEEVGCNEADVCAELTLGQNILYGRSQAVEASLFSPYGQPIGGYVGPIQRLPLTSATMTIPESTAENCEEVQTNELEADEMEENTVDGNVPPPVSGEAMDSVPGVTDVEERMNPLAFPVPFIPMWPSHPLNAGIMNQDFWYRDSKLVKPTPIIPSPPVKVEDTMKISQLSISVTRPMMEPTPLSYKLLEEGSRQSAFHMTSTPSSDKEIDGQGSLDKAISVP